ncbi:MAG: ABC transporter substrate-binding protein [Oculatellaceae cyanobacterium Prado106]|nr:ABC transporter substrate-binding protein [Oculatellaceae cyanobacterium Prado106]
MRIGISNQFGYRLWRLRNLLRLRNRIFQGSVGLLLVVAIALSGSLSGCSLRTAAARVPQMVFATPSDPSTFNYALNDSLFSLFVFGYLYEGLIGENGLTRELEPRLAESWKVSDDKLKVEFTLREGLRWSDGQPLTADDIVFTFKEIYLNPKITTGVKDILRVGESGAFPSIRQIDDRRVEFTVPEPFAPFIRNVGALFIYPAHILRESTQKTDSQGNLLYLSTWGTDSDPRKIIANGPYVMDRYISGQRVIFKRNPNYWRKDDQGQPQPYVERIITQVVGSEDGQLLSFRSGDLDAFAINPESFQLMKQEEQRGKYTIYNGGADPGSRFFGFNLTKAKNASGKPFVDPLKSKWFNNQAFRQAVAYAIDRDRMVNNIYQGIGELQNSPFDSGNPFMMKPEEGLKVYNHDPEKSKKLLQDAGFRYNEKAELLDTDGNRVQFVLLVKSEEKARVSVAAQIQQDLARIGMKVDLQVLAFNSIIKKLTSRDWEAYVGGFGGGSAEPHSGVNIWSSKGDLHQFNMGPREGEPPITGWEVTDWEKEIDRLFIAGARELDDQKRRVIYNQFQQIVQEQLPFIHLVNPLSLQAVRNRITPIKFSASGGAFWNIHELKNKFIVGCGAKPHTPHSIYLPRQ